jgi:aromatic-L-amino-acid decarboxylase
MKKAANLELSSEEMWRMGEAALRAAIDHIVRLPRASSNNLENSAAIVHSLKEPPPERGTDFDTLLRLFMDKVVPVSLTTPHPSYMAYIPGGGLYPSAIGDFLGAAVNRFAGASFAAPAASRLEANVLDWFARWMGYPDTARGILTSGGSLANFSAIVTARAHLLGDDISGGIIYTTDQAHHCILKSAILAGIPEKNVRLLETDGCFKAVPERFEAAIREDRDKGLRPFLIVASAGTTNTGAVDPLPELAEVAGRNGVWYHLDAAYGGFFNLTERGKKKLAGIDHSDSVVLDPHKGLFLPYGSGSLLVKDGRLLRQAHMLTADYMQDHAAAEGDISPTEYSPELSRSFRGLRVWFPLKLLGVQAFRENLDEKLDLTEWLSARLREVPACEFLAEPELTVIPFRFRPARGDVDAFNRKLLRNINMTKKLYLSSTLLRGEFVIRVCILSFRTHIEQVEEAFEVITSEARKVAGT